MKRTVLITILISSLIFVPSVRAEDRRNIRAEVREETRNKITTAKKERVMSFTNQMTLRLEATLERLQKLVEKINARIVKITDENEKKNIESVKLSLTQAQKLIDGTQVKIDALKTDLDTMLSSESPKDAFMKTKESITTIKNDIKEIHSILVSTINVIKGLRVGNSTQNEK